MRSSAEVLLCYDDFFLRHDPGPFHPESPLRLRTVRARIGELEKMGAQLIVPRTAGADEIELVHEGSYVRMIERLSLAGGFHSLDPDTYVSESSYECARLAAGAGISMLELICSGKAKRGFGIVRPPGHHACASKAMGFCLFNNIAILAMTARLRFHLGRIAIFDWDVHHGNGTQEIFYDDPHVLYISIHQYPHYPGTGHWSDVGKNEGRGFTLNIPLPPGSGDPEYAVAMRDVVAPVINSFKPDLVLVSAGFDSALGDPLGSMRVDFSVFQFMAYEICKVADKTCKGRVIALLEGGYDPENVYRGVRSTLSAFCGQEPVLDVEEMRARVSCVDALTRVKDFHSQFWSVLR